MMKKFPPGVQMAHYAVTAWSMTAGPSEKGLNAYKIVQAAMKIADRKGLEAVTIRSIAEQTGFSTMAVYRHIDSRDELMLLLIERVLGQAPKFEAATWQEGVTAWAKSLLQCYVEHPWALALPIGGIPVTPNHISWIEQILRILAPTELSLQMRLDIALLIDAHVRQFAGISAASGKAANAHVQDLQWLQDVAADTAPTYLLALQQGAMQSQKGPKFTSGLQAIIKGIEASLPVREKS